MKIEKLEDFTNEQLAEKFVELSREMGMAVLDSETRKFNKMFPIMQRIDMILRARGREARLVLLPLLESDDRFVRYYAAKYLLGLVPAPARAVIEDIARYKYDALCGHAGMCLYALDKGIFRPD